MKQIGKLLVDKIIDKWSRFKYFKRQNTYKKSNSKIKTIAILFYIPKSNLEKYNNWEDGFTKAINLLEEDYVIEWINLEDRKPDVKELNTFDFIIAKSCWNWVVDIYIRSLKGLKTKRGIAISCSIKTKKEWAYFYDVLWYETEWYKQFILFHPNKFLAFGANSDVFKPLNIEKKFDVLSVGAITSYKRLHLLNNLPGKRKLIIGNMSTSDFEIVKSKLDDSIEIIDYVNQESLAIYYNQSKLVYIPAEIDGGGERAVLESLLCGVEIKIEHDNFKLKSLIDNNSPITKYDYSFGIRKGLNSFYEDKTFKTNLIESKENLKCGINSFYNKNFIIKGNGNVTIGSFCSFGDSVKIITENHDYNYVSTQGYIYRKYLSQNHPGEIALQPTKVRSKGPVIIGNDVWIGDDVTILSGVNIGNGVCIASNSLIVNNVEDYSIVGGLPAKLLKYRYNLDIIAFLQNLEWWNWSEKRIINNKDFFNTNINNVSIEELKAKIK